MPKERKHYTLMTRSKEPKTADVYELYEGKQRMMATFWNVPGDEGVHARRMAQEVVDILNGDVVMIPTLTEVVTA